MPSVLHAVTVLRKGSPARPKTPPNYYNVDCATLYTTAYALNWATVKSICPQSLNPFGCALVALQNQHIDGTTPSTCPKHWPRLVRSSMILVRDALSFWKAFLAATGCTLRRSYHARPTSQLLTFVGTLDTRHLARATI